MPMKQREFHKHYFKPVLIANRRFISKINKKAIKEKVSKLWRIGLLSGRLLSRRRPISKTKRYIFSAKWVFADDNATKSIIEICWHKWLKNDSTQKKIPLLLNYKADGIAFSLEYFVCFCTEMLQIKNHNPISGQSFGFYFSRFCGALMNFISDFLKDRKGNLTLRTLFATLFLFTQ